MADLSQHSNYTGAYSGLLDNLWVTITISGICLLGYEIEVRIPRRRGRDGTFRRIPVRLYLFAKQSWEERAKAKRGVPIVEGRPSQEGLVREKVLDDVDKSSAEAARKRAGDRESWEFGYIYQPKVWRLNPAPPVPKWPLAWIWSSLKVRESDMPETCGLDITLHARFLRASFFYTLMQACIVLPILMPLHIFYSPTNISSTSMMRASVSSLVESSGARWLWVHAILIWWITITWTATVIWITWGGLAYRRREVRRLTERVKEARADQNRLEGGELGLTQDQVAEKWSIGENSEGIKRFRTLMVTNIPPDMREEQTLQDYFDHYLHRHRVRKGQADPRITPPPVAVSDKKDNVVAKVVLSPKRLLKKPAEIKFASSSTSTPPNELADSLVDKDRLPESASVLSRRDKWESEVDEVILVRKLGSIASLRARRTTVLRQLEVAHVKLVQRVLVAVKKYKAKYPEVYHTRARIPPVHNMDKGIGGLNAARDEPLPDGITKHERMVLLVQALGGYVDDEPEQLGKSTETVWDVLHSLPRELLDPYQSLTGLKSRLKDQKAPLIDYLTTKLSYLTLCLDEARDKPLSSYVSSSAAFVTFRDAKTARLALKVLGSHPRRSLACHTVPAPEWTDILWPRLAKSVYRSEFVRGWVVYIGVWAFTLVWIFPVSLLCALSSLNNIAGFSDSLANFIAKNPKTASLITSLVPVILVAGLTIAICPILLVIANKAETIVTRLGIHNSVLERFWKFLMVNGVVFFSVGQSAIEAYLTAFQSSNFNPLPTVASAFPTAAPYFASYVLLQVAIQPFFEIWRLGLPTIIYVFGTRVSTVPRQRNSRTAHPTFSHFSQLPQQLLGGAILHLFMLLNPLVIPFCLVYYGCCYVVWKRQFTYVYGRLYENNGKRSSISILRYSLDALGLAQFVLFAFFVLNKAKGHAIATGVLFFLTMVSKLIITRALKSRFYKLDVQEADLLCPSATREQDQIASPEIDHPVSQPGSTAAEEEQAKSSSGAKGLGRKLTIFKEGMGTLAHRRHKKSDVDGPLPFDHVFSTLDTRFDFGKEDPDGGVKRSDTIKSAESDIEMVHEPDHAIYHTPAARLVMPHHHLRPWEDIPPYQRARGYNYQPAYTNDYDDYLWLPRDPLSTLDLDDTIELRLSLTTSAGGDGRIGDWPPLIESEDDEMEYLIGDESIWKEGPESPTASRLSSPSPERDIAQLAFSPQIGSEVEGAREGGLVRRSTRKVSHGLNTLFHRSRSVSRRSELGISMQELSNGRIDLENVPLRDSYQGVNNRPFSQLVSRPAGPRPNIRKSAPGAAALKGLSEPPDGLGSRSDEQEGPQSRLDVRRPSTISSDGSFFLPSNVRTITPSSIESTAMDIGPIEELDLGEPQAGSSASANPDLPVRRTGSVAQLGRAGARRIPRHLRLQGETPNGELAVSAYAPSFRSPARSMSMALRNRNVSSSAQAAQQQWLEDVMEEEFKANKGDRQEEREEQRKDQEELMKEQARVQEELAKTASRSRAPSLHRARSTSRFGSTLGRSFSGASRGSVTSGASGLSSSLSFSAAHGGGLSVAGSSVGPRVETPQRSATTSGSGGWGGGSFRRGEASGVYIDERDEEPLILTP